MSQDNQTQPGTPVEMCKRLGWGPGTRLKLWYGVLDRTRYRQITALGSRKVFWQDEAGNDSIWASVDPNVTYTEEKPLPDVHFSLPDYGGAGATACLRVGDYKAFQLVSVGGRVSVLPYEYDLPVLQAMVEAGKAKVEELLGKTPTEPESVVEFTVKRTAKGTHAVVDWRSLDKPVTALTLTSNYGLDSELGDDVVDAFVAQQAKLVAANLTQFFRRSAEGR